MYDYISGKLVELSPAHAIIDVGGIGYNAFISLTSYSVLNEQLTAKIFIHQAIREDAHLFFGFVHKSERDMFRSLISVNGVGPSSAMLILSSGTASEIKEYILHENTAALQRVKGIGAKTAQRIILDLKDKIAKLSDEELPQTPSGTLKHEALSALVMLGFVKFQAQKVIDKILSEKPNIDIETLIKESLKRL